MELENSFGKEQRKRSVESIKQFFSYMNEVSFPYVVLRNWDSLPYDIALGEHSDLDLLVYDREHFMELFPQAKLEFPLPRVRTRLPIGGSFIYMDIRFVGDDYYPEDFENNILKTREWNPRGFYTPDPMHHRIALAYHAVHHKNEISNDYRRWLGDATITEMLSALRESNVGWVKPSDKTVGSFNGYWKGATSIVAKEYGRIIKQQVNYKRYPLIENEFDILGKINSEHFPKAIILFDGSLLMEDCGEPLSELNIPDSWKNQLQDIITCLQKFGIQHRDIKLENLMVSGGVIKLIDFGWAVPFSFRLGKFAELEQSPPTCLGFPNRPSAGFSDSFSMRRVIKQIDYMLEEKEHLQRQEA